MIYDVIKRWVLALPVAMFLHHAYNLKKIDFFLCLKFEKYCLGNQIISRNRDHHYYIERNFFLNLVKPIHIWYNLTKLKKIYLCVLGQLFSKSSVALFFVLKRRNHGTLEKKKFLLSIWSENGVKRDFQKMDEK